MKLLHAQVGPGVLGPQLTLNSADSAATRVDEFMLSRSHGCTLQRRYYMNFVAQQIDFQQLLGSTES